MDAGPTDSVEIYLEPDGVVVVGGEFDLAGIEIFEAVTEPLRDGPSDVSIDLSRCTFIDSTALHAIVRFSRTSGDRDVVLLRPSAHVRRVMGLVGLDGREGIRIER